MTRLILDPSGCLRTAVLFLSVTLAGQAASAAEVTSILRVRQDPVGPRGPAQASQLAYKQTLAALIKTRFVITAALQKTKDSELSVLQRQQNPTDWLLESLQVDSPENSELIRITLAGTEQDTVGELSQVLNAVVEAFLKEIVEKDRLNKVASLGSLRRQYNRNYKQIQEKTDAVQTLAKQLGSLKSDSVKAELRLRGFRYQRLLKQLDRLETRLLDIRLEKVAVRTRDEDQAKQQTEILSAQADFLVDKIAELNRSIESATEQYRELHGASGDLEARIQELTGLREITQDLHRQIQALEIEIEVPPKVNVIQPAG